MKLKILLIISITLTSMLFVWWKVQIDSQEKLTKPLPKPQKSEVEVVKSPTPQVTPEPTLEELISVSYNQDTVPFTSQSPYAEWKDPRQQDACEEASVLMAVKWAQGKPIESKQTAKEEILALALFQKEKYGEFRDTSAFDTSERLFKGYYQYNNIELKNNITLKDILFALSKNRLVITPMNGQALGNPSFTPPGPERHMVLIIGYDGVKKEFITNDPGISGGKGYRYPIEVFYQAIRDYPTGYHIPISGVEKNMIVVRKS